MLNNQRYNSIAQRSLSSLDSRKTICQKSGRVPNAIFPKSQQELVRYKNAFRSINQGVDAAVVRKHLLVNLLLGNLGGLSLLGGQEGADPAQSLVADDEGSGNSSLALTNKASLLLLLGLGTVDLEDVVAALDTFVVGEEDQALGVVVQLGGRLLDDGEGGIEAVEGLVANGVRTLNVGRNVLVWLGEVGEDRSSEGLVSRVTELEGALGVLVALDGGDAVVDQRVVEEMLEEGRVVSRAGDIAVDLGDSHCVSGGGGGGCLVLGRYDIREKDRIEPVTD